MKLFPDMKSSDLWGNEENTYLMQGEGINIEALLGPELTY
jgi:hypothetical protein